jgi:hypothetical protein
MSAKPCGKAFCRNHVNLRNENGKEKNIDGSELKVRITVYCEEDICKKKFEKANDFFKWMCLLISMVGIVAIILLLIAFGN